MAVPRTVGIATVPSDSFQRFNTVPWANTMWRSFTPAFRNS
jgi:hypothetical protein